MGDYFSFDIWIPALIVGAFVTILAQSQDRHNMGCTSGLIGLMAGVLITGFYRLVASQLDGRPFWILTGAALILIVTIIGYFATFAVRENGRRLAAGEGAGIGMVAGGWTALGVGIILSPVSLIWLFGITAIGLVLGALFGAAANRGRATA